MNVFMQAVLVIMALLAVAVGVLYLIDAINPDAGATAIQQTAAATIATACFALATALAAGAVVLALNKRYE